MMSQNKGMAMVRGTESTMNVMQNIGQAEEQLQFGAQGNQVRDNNDE